MLLEKSHPEYGYFTSYDEEYGYYDDDQYLTADLERAKRACTEYVVKNEGWAYGIITKQHVTDSQLSQIKRYDQTKKADDWVELSRVYPDYTPDSVVFSVCKKQGVVTQNFIKKEDTGETV